MVWGRYHKSANLLNSWDSSFHHCCTHLWLNFINMNTHLWTDTKCKMTSFCTTWDLSTVHLFPKGCIYICKFYCTENIQNVHNYRYNIPQSCPGITKHRCLALEKLCSLVNIIILNTFSTNTFKCMSVW